jgi:hypothetical protein
LHARAVPASSWPRIPTFWTAVPNRRSLARVALRDLWRKLTRRRVDDKEFDSRPTRDKVRAAGALDHFVQPPKPTGQDKPKY